MSSESEIAIDFTHKNSKSIMNEFAEGKVEKIKIFKSLEISCVHISIKSNLVQDIFNDIHFSPLTSFYFYFDSISYLTYLSICNQDLCALIEIDYDGFENDNFNYILEKMKNTLLVTSTKHKTLFSFFAKIDEYFFLTDSESTFLQRCVSTLKAYILKEYDLQNSQPTMTYSSFLNKSIKSILYYFLFRQSISPHLFYDRTFFEFPLSVQMKEYEVKDFLFLEVMKYDPSYFIQYAFHKETQTLAISYVFRVEPIGNFWENSFKYPYIYEPCGYIKPNIEIKNEETDDLLEEENENENQIFYGCLIYPFINMIDVRKLNQSLLLDATMKTKIIYTIFYALDYIYYNSEIKMKSPDIFLTKIFFDSNFNVIISNGTDFFDTFQTGHIESPLYLPTEFIECMVLKNEKTDIYSAGVCIYLLLSSDVSIEKKNLFQLCKQLHISGFPTISDEFGHLSFIQKLCCSDINENKRKNSFLILHLLNFFHCRVKGTNENEINEYIKDLEKNRIFVRNESYFNEIKDIQSKSSENSNCEYMLQLGLLYLFGEGVDKNIEKALKLINNAAEYGYKDAMYILEFINSNHLF